MANRRSGIREEPTEGCARTFLKPKLARLPRKGPAVCEKVREYPQKNHWKQATAVAMTESQMSDNADFLLARPE